MSGAKGAKGPVLARVVLHVGDLAQAESFYGTLLGVPGRRVGGGRAYFDCGGVILALLDPGGGGSAPRPAPDNLYFAVADVEAVHARASGLRCLDQDEVHGEAAGAIVRRPWGERSFYCVDPWGNGLCFLDEVTLFRGDSARRG